MTLVAFVGYMATASSGYSPEWLALGAAMLVIPAVYVKAEPCIGTKDTACVDACPVDCIHPKSDEDDHETEELLYIDPEECIDCGACVPVCPVSAIFALEDLPEKWDAFTERNAAYYNK